MYLTNKVNKRKNEMLKEIINSLNEQELNHFICNQEIKYEQTFSKDSYFKKIDDDTKKNTIKNNNLMGISYVFGLTLELIIRHPELINQTTTYIKHLFN